MLASYFIPIGMKCIKCVYKLAGSQWLPRILRARARMRIIKRIFGLTAKVILSNITQIIKLFNLYQLQKYT